MGRRPGESLRREAESASRAPAPRRSLASPPRARTELTPGERGGSGAALSLGPRSLPAPSGLVFGPSQGPRPPDRPAPRGLPRGLQFPFPAPGLREETSCRLGPSAPGSQGRAREPAGNETRPAPGRVRGWVSCRRGLGDPGSPALRGEFASLRNGVKGPAVAGPGVRGLSVPGPGGGRRAQGDLPRAKPREGAWLSPAGAGLRASSRSESEGLGTPGS